MLLFLHDFKNNNIGNYFNSKRGFSLIELLIAITLLMIIVLAFTPLFIGSIERIYYSGDKSEALFEGQSELEVRTVERDTADNVHSTEIIYDFGDETTVIVPGGVIESEQVEGDAEAWLSAFLPYIPSIQLNYLFLDEGYEIDTLNGLEVLIMGSDTDLGKADTVKIYTRNSFDEDPAEPDHELTFTYYNSVPAGYSSQDYGGYDEYATVIIPEGFTNAEGPYTFEMEWTVDDITIVTRKRLMVSMPNAVAIGDNGEIMVSPDTDQIWNSRAHNVTLSDINEIVWAFSKYIAVTSDGSIITWERQEEPTASNVTALDSNVSLNDLLFDGNMLIAVGSNGAILTSTNGVEWNIQQDNKTYELNAVSWSGSEYVAVGSNGTHLTSDNGINWSENVVDNNADLHGAAYGQNKWVIAGAYIAGDSDGKAVIFYENGGGWEPVVRDTGNTAFYDIIYDNNEFTAVGQGGDDKKGLIVSSEFGSDWDTLTSAEYNTFLSVYWDGDPNNKYIVLGEQGTVVTGNENTWEEQQTDSSEKLRGVAIR